MVRYFTNLVKKSLKTGVLVGTLFTAYQASQKTKAQGGSFQWDRFVGNFKTQGAKNIRQVAGFTKGLIGKYFNSYRVSDKGENGYTYKNAAPQGDKVNEVFETIREVAPGVIDKVQDFVDDVRENAPEYKAKAQAFVDGVADAAIKALELDGEGEKAKEEPPVKQPEKAAAPKAAKAEKAAKAAAPEKAARTRKATKTEAAAAPEKAAKPTREKKSAKGKKEEA